MFDWLLILLLILLAFGFGAFAVFLSRFLGPHNPTPEKMAPYECGMPAIGDARERQSIRFYLVAMIFLLFDIEVAFLYPWAVIYRNPGAMAPLGIPLQPTQAPLRVLYRLPVGLQR